MSYVSSALLYHGVEEMLGNTHECRECGARFTAWSDGCPVCDSPYIRSIVNLRDIPDEEGNEAVKPLFRFRYDEKTHRIIYYPIEDDETSGNEK